MQRGHSLRWDELGASCSSSAQSVRVGHRTKCPENPPGKEWSAGKSQQNLEVQLTLLELNS